VSRPALDARGRDVLAIVLPTLLAAILCVYEITSRSLGFDEGATVAIASQHGSALWSAIAHDGGNMSGYYLLLHVLIEAFGSSLLVLRIASVVAASATVAVVVLIGLRLFDRRAGVVAGVLTATSLPLVYWAQTARGYAPMVAFVCGAFLAFVAFVHGEDRAPAGRARGADDPGARTRWGPWVAYVVLMVLAMYCTFVAVLVVPAQLLAVARRPRAARRLASALVAIALCCIPLVLLAVRRGSGQLFWVPRPSHKVETQVLESLTSSGLQSTFHRTSTTYVLMALTLLALLGIAVVFVRAALRGQASWATGMLLAWFLVPVVLTFIYSLLAQPLFLPRNVLMCVPALALLLALVLADARLPVLVAVGALVTVVALRALQLGAAYGVSPEPWRQATAQVLARAHPGDCIAFYPEDGRMAFDYYVASTPAAVSRAPRSILPVLGWGAVKPLVEDYVSLSGAELAIRSAGCRRLWFVSSHEGELDGSDRSRANRALYHRLGAELERAFGSGPVQKYGYASAVHVQLLPGRR
jgi:mannosyltransferase